MSTSTEPTTPARRRAAPRPQHWHVTAEHRRNLARLCPRWAQDLIGAVFIPKTAHDSPQVSMMVEGMAQGLAWLERELATGRRVRVRRRQQWTAGARFDPRDDLFNSLALTVAEATRHLGRAWLRDWAPDLHPIVALEALLIRPEEV